jgi:hypothetical protein
MTTLLFEILDELAECAKEEGLDAKTLRLWAAGKCIGGPVINIGLETPKTCAVLAEHMERKD